jgi:hypothetical protein
MTKRRTVSPLPRKWRNRLERAVVDPEYAQQNAGKWTHESANWTQCAIGERREMIKKLGYKFNRKFGIFSDNVPKSEEMYHLGMQFYIHVKNGDYRNALGIIYKIDRILITKKPEQEVT